MGRPKSFMEIGGQPILIALADRLRWPGPSLLVSSPGRECPPGADQFGREVVDAVAEEGPMRGLLTALENSTTDIIVVVTVDMPNVAGEQLGWLISRLAERPGCLGLATSRATDSKAFTEPFPSAYRRAAREAVTSCLSRGELSVHRLFGGAGFELAAAPLAWESLRVWTNLNTPADVSDFKGDR